MQIPVPPKIRWDPSALRGQGMCRRAVASVALSAAPHRRSTPVLPPRRWVAHRSSLQSQVIRPAAWTNVDETQGRRRSTGSRTSRAPTSSGRWATTDSLRSFSLPAVRLQQSMDSLDSWQVVFAPEPCQKHKLMSVNLFAFITTFNRDLVCF